MKKALYLDDIRTPTETLPGYEEWNVVRNYDEFKEWVLKNGTPDLISFDHDLGEEHMLDYYFQVKTKGYQEPEYDRYEEKTGLDCAKWLCEAHCYPNSLPLPECVVHSHNPIGAKNIQEYINGYLRHMQEGGTCRMERFPFKIEKKEGSN